MSVIRKVREVEKVFADLEKEMNILRHSSGLHCVAGCGKCCFKPEIEASPVEFLPYALHLLRNEKIEEVYDKLLQNTSTQCTLFSPVWGSDMKGACSEYPYRGLICRLFGYAASRGMDGEAKLVTCRIIKEGQSSIVAKIEADLKEDKASVPLMSDYYFRIRSIDPDLGTKLLPINKAIQTALEVVMSYYAYRDAPSSEE
ncbi:MAG: YkgJ family cysteine cluster protein [Roseivirga sp.]|nr:YkgJ family cysteine cluster protein [Roseivirga sp.]